MKLLITGPTGFLGSRLIQHYKDRCEVVAAGRGEVDIKSRDSILRLFQRERPDAAIHCAGIADLQDCERNPQEAYRINVESAVWMAEACAELGGKPVLCSSDQIYFENRMCGVTAHQETEVPVPFNLYGKQKLEMEELCKEVNGQAVCLRLSWMYDFISGSDKEHGDLFRNVRHAVRVGTSLAFPIHDLRGITYMKEVVQNMEKVFAIPGGVYNYGSSNDRNTCETVRLLLDELGHSGYPVAENQDAFREVPRNIVMAGEKIAAFGIEFQDTAEGLKRCVRDERAAAKSN